MKRQKLKSAGSRVFKFKKGDYWDGDEQIIDWIMWKLGVECGEMDNQRIKQDTYFTIHCAKKTPKEQKK
jgi:hypothetical protein